MEVGWEWGWIGCRVRVLRRVGWVGSGHIWGGCGHLCI